MSAAGRGAHRAACLDFCAYFSERALSSRTRSFKYGSHFAFWSAAASRVSL